MARLVPALAAFALLCLPPVLGEAAQPMVVALDWQAGRFDAAVSGEGVAHEASWPLWIDACHRRFWVDLLYEPRDASVDVDGTKIRVPYEFEVELTVGNLSMGTTVRDPGHGHFLGEAPTWGEATVVLRLLRGAFVDWSFRLRGWEVPGEPACVPRIFVNELEANPAGTDAGQEWLELHNPGTFGVDVGQWSIETTHGVTHRFELPAGLIVPRFGFAVVTFGSQFLDNVNESVLLRLPGGEIHDQTPVLSDESNNANAWQRLPDGARDWAFRAATKGISNGA